MQKIKNSLSAKVFLLVFCALLSCSLIIYAIISVTLPQRYTTLVNRQTSANINEMLNLLENTDLRSTQEQIYNFCIENRTYALLHTDDGTLVFGDEGGVTDTDGTFTVSATIKLSDQRNPSTLTIISSASAANEVRHTLLTLLPAILGLILFISALSAWLCGRNIVCPVIRICDVSKRMAQLDMTWRCDESRSDELGVLAQSLNSLSERLSLAMSDLTEANERLRADVEKTQAMEKQRRDFFIAASHELKTPLTVLKGQLESMELGIGDYKNHEKYLPQAILAVESMEALIREILAISKMESGISHEAFSEESLQALIIECVRGITPLAEQKQITISVPASEDTTLYIYRPLFKKAVTNILQNAVRYSPNGQCVEITWSDQALWVCNGGVQIASEDLDLLFTPFYRAEKSRNRKSGGSGLGLYLVKTILDLHGYSCKIENTKSGVRFTVVFRSGQ